MQVVGYHITPYGVTNSDGQSCNVKDRILNFLLEIKGDDVIKCFYHMDYSVANLLKMLDIDEYHCRKLHEEKSFTMEGFRFFYVPGKTFSIRDSVRDNTNNRPFANFSDASQYIQGWQLNEFDNDTVKADTARIAGNIALDTFESIGLNPTTLTSPIRAFQKEWLDKAGLPTVDDIPYEAGLYAYKCCHGGWVEAYQKGHYQDTWDYDIASAYPYYLSQLVDTRHGTWLESQEYVKTAYYGYARCIVDIESPFSPIICSVSREAAFTPVGEFETYLTKADIDFIQEFKIGEVKIKHGWWWTPNRDPIRHTAVVYRPFKKVMNRLYEKKEAAENGIRKDIIKRIMAGCWGKLLEIRHDAKKDEEGFGEQFNPVWGAEVETQTRLAVARFILSHNILPSLLSVAVDGVLLSHPINIEVNGAMGEWKLTANCPAFVIGSGVVAVKDKLAVSEFSANYEWLIEQIESNPKASKYYQTKLSPVTLAKACNLNWIDKLGSLVEITKTIDVEYEGKRLYRVAPVNGGQLMKKQYVSDPVDISMIDMLAIELEQGGVNENTEVVV